MKSVENVSTVPFPKVGDRIRLLTFDPVSQAVEKVYTVQKVLPCTHRVACVQDDRCTYCLCLTYRTEEDQVVTGGQHCWNDPQGKCYWEIL